MFIKRNLLIIAAALTALPALAQFAKPEDAIKYRKSSFFVMGQHFGRIGAMAQGRVPFDAKAAADNAAVVEVMSKLHWAAFTEGIQAEATKLSAAAKTGSLDNIKTAFAATGGTCKGCHDNFRKD